MSAFSDFEAIFGRVSTYQHRQSEHRGDRRAQSVTIAPSCQDMFSMPLPVRGGVPWRWSHGGDSWRAHYVIA